MSPQKPKEDYKFKDGRAIDEEFADLTVANLREITKRIGSFKAPVLISRCTIYNAIEQAEEAMQDDFRAAVLGEKQAGRTKYSSTSRQGQKRVMPEGETETRRPKRPRPNPPDAGVEDQRAASTQIATNESTLLNIDITLEDQIAKLILSDFMRAPSETTIEDSLTTFIDKTNNAAVVMCSCACCAREWNREDVYQYHISQIPNKRHLQPTIPHPKHDLFESALLYPPAIDSNGIADICSECHRQLKNDKMPKYALANGLWIGEVPPELSNLTLPERMLIAKYFPAAFIVKLYPKSKGSGGWKKSQLHNGLRGNVSTYMLDPKQVASMVTGPVMPPPATVLSATIGITFIGPKGLPESSMPGMFHVRRERVRRALQWLKENNPLYADIEISESRLQTLPVNGIPEELIRTAKFSEDIDAVYAEHESYVPNQDDSDEEDEERPNQQDLENAGLIPIPDDDDEDLNVSPEILPLNSLGVVDVDGVAITDQELMAHALANTAQQPLPEDFAIRHGSAFVNEYARTTEDGQRNDGGPSNPNHLLGCFPTLFPYGLGGFEVERIIDIPYEVHVQWALAYADKRFRLDYHFPFQVFGVCQKRQVCRAAVLQMKKSTFSQNIGAISRLTEADFLEASKEETRGVPFSNPAIRALRKQISAIRTRVKGTDESRVAIRSKVWGMNLAYNPPSLWVTINPTDTQDPIAQVIAGIAIDLDRFCNTAGPDNEQRAINMASDPYASAKFFHFIIETVLAFLFGIKKKREGTSNPEGGILGKVQGYIGTVEAQGRGTLHLHLLLWLKDAPSSRVMEAALKTEAFREKIKSYIKAVIRADVDELNHEEVRRLIPKESAISYSRPLDPRTHDANAIAAQNRKIARAVQLHKCSQSTCLKSIGGRLKCKRRAPFKTALDDWVEPNGEWGPKRFCAFFNSWNPTILSALRSNHDIKLILNGAVTKSVTWYITNYATKKQQRTSNISAILAKKYAFHKCAEKRTSDICLANKKLIQRCANALSSSHEFSAPEIMSYLMGWGDRYESHTFAPIYMDSAMIALKQAFPELVSSTYTPQWNGDDVRTAVESTSGATNPSNDPDAETEVTISFVVNTVLLKDQFKDYQFRGDALEDMSLYEFVLETYEGRRPTESTDEDDGEGSDADTNENTPRVGRPRSTRVDEHCSALPPENAYFDTPSNSRNI